MKFGARKVLVWVLAGLVLMAAVIGLEYLTRGTSVRHVRGVGADGRPVTPSEPEFPLSVAMLTGAVCCQATAST